MIFWVIALLLSVLALLFVIPPLLRTVTKTGPDHNQVNISIYQQKLNELDADFKNNSINQTQYDQSKLELEKSLLQDLPEDGQTDVATNVAKQRWTAVAVFITVPTIAFLMYAGYGSFDAISKKRNAVTQTASHDSNLPSVEALLEKLIARLETNPNDGQGWLMLGRSYMATSRYPDASKAYERAYNILGDDPDLLANYAESLAATNNNRLSGKPTALINKALERDPAHQKALWLAGHAAMELKHPQEAVAYWNRLLENVPTDSDAAATVKKFIAQAQGDVAPSPQVQTPTQSATTGTSINVSAQLSDKLRDKVSPTDTVFIFAQAASGPKMPLAIVRKQVKDLPITVTLDDSMAMMPAMTLSQFSEVIVGARISKSGNAARQSGDLQGMSQSFNPKTNSKLQISITDIVP